MNNFVFDGRLTADPEMGTTQTGVEVCKFTVANDRRKKGEEKQSSFFRCQAYGKTGAFINQYFHKGDPIQIVGECEVRPYEDKDGNKRTATTVYVDKASFSLGKGKNAEQVSSDGFSPIDDAKLPF